MATIKCPQCEKEQPSDAKFCGNCGNNLRGTCENCGEVIPLDSKFCNFCGKPAKSDVEPVKNRRWACLSNHLFQRIDEEDLQGSLRKGLIVEFGQRAMLINEGQNAGTLDQGFYNLSTFGKRITTLNFAAPTSVYIYPTGAQDLRFKIDDLFTKEEVKVGVECVVTVRLEKPEFFLNQLMHGRQRYTIEDLQTYLVDELRNILQPVLHQRSVKELYGNEALKRSIEQTMDTNLRETLSKRGIALDQLRFIDYTSETWDRVREKYPDLFMGVEKEVIDARWGDLHNKILDRKFAQEMAARRTFQDRYNYLSELDKERLLTDMDKQELIFALKGKNTDLEVAQKVKELEAEGRLQEIRDNMDLKHRLALATSDVEAKQVLDEYYRVKQIKDAKAAYEIQSDRLKLFEAWKRSKVEIDKLEKDAKADYIAKLAAQGPEALMVGVSEEEASRLKNVLEMKLAEKLTPEQLLAFKSADSPHLATAWQEYFKHHSGAEVRQMYEKMLEDKNEMINRFTEFASRMTQTLGEARTPHTVLTPMGTVAYGPTPGYQAPVIVCAGCQTKNDQNVKFCKNCGQAIS